MDPNDFLELLKYFDFDVLTNLFGLFLSADVTDTVMVEGVIDC